MNKTDLDIAYLPLVDSAPFILAEHLGYFSQMGLKVTLHKEVSWALVRDKLAIGARDAAQMLAPLPAMTTLGVSGMRVPLLTGLGLSKNGNGITISAVLWQQMLAGLQLAEDYPVSAANVTDVIVRAARQTEILSRQLTFAVVHGFSTHAILLRRWLRSAGVDPDAQVKMIVVPPSQMVDSLSAGVIDGYCVGEPWSTLAIKLGVGIAAAWGAEVWAEAPEKVLCVTEQWHEQNPATHHALRIALMHACGWLSRPDNALEAAQVMSAKQYLDIEDSVLERALSGHLARTRNSAVEQVPNFLSFFDNQTNDPGGDSALQILDGCNDLLGRSVDPVQRHMLARRCFRSDLFHHTLQEFDDSAVGP